MAQSGGERLGLFELHAAVLLFGIAGLFGKFLTLSPFVIVLGRSTFAAGSLIFLQAATGGFSRQRLGDIRRAFPWLLLSGTILAYHWVSFFHAIQVSTVAVGLLTFSSFPLFVTVLEPWITRQHIRVGDALAAVLVLAGLICIIPRFDLGDHITLGVCWGTSSGAAFAVLSLINKRLVRNHSAVVVSAGQNLFAAVFLLLLAAMLRMPVSKFTFRDLLLLACLGVICTAIAHTLFIKGMKHVRAQLASIIAGMEVLYGAGFAFLFLGEVPTLRTIVGGVFILAAVYIGTVRRPILPDDASYVAVTTQPYEHVG